MRKWVVLLLAAVLLFMSAGCGKKGDQAKPEEKPADVTVYPMIVVDDLGRSVEITAEPKRIVSLIPSLTETLFAVGAGDRVVGVTTYCNYPAEVQNIEKVGDLFNINAEVILGLTPDLVLTPKSSTITETLKFLEDNGIPYVVIDPKTLDEIQESFITIGKIVNLPAGGEAVAAQVREERKALEAKVQEKAASGRPGVFVLLDTDSVWTVGKGEFISDLIYLAGGVNVAEESGSGWILLSEEAFFTLDPDVIICTFPISAQVLAKEAWKDLSAIKNGRVYDVNEDLVSRSGPRIVQGLEELFAAFYK